MKQLRSAMLVALALCALGATPASASTTGTSSSLVVAITAEGPSVTSLYNGASLTTTSVTLGSPLSLNVSGLGSISDILGALGSLPKAPGAPLILPGDLYGHHPVWAGGPSTSPIPEARTLLLYAAGFSLVAWAVVRRGQRSH